MSKTIYGNDSGQIIDLPVDVDTAIGGNGNDILRGNVLANTISGSGGNDHLWGGLGGNDTLAGGLGNDCYWFGTSDGFDTITNATDNGQDEVFFYNVGVTGYRAYNQNSNLMFSTDENNVLQLEQWYNAPSNSRVQSFVFANKTAYAWNNGSGAAVNLHDDIYESNQIHTLISGDRGNCVLRGGSGEDTIVGGKANDQLWGGPGGNDTLSDGSGANTFWFGNGDGNDVILNGGTNQDVVKLYNVTNADISRSNNDLVLTTNQGAKLTLSDWYVNNSTKVNQFLFSDGTVKSITDSGWQTAGAGASGFTIEVDYSRYDSMGFFTNHPERRAVVAEACRIWEGIIMNDFKNVSSGTMINVVNANTGVIEQVRLDSDIDDLRIYMGSSSMSNSSTLAVARPFTLSATGITELDNRYNSATSIQPWVGSISVNVNNESQFYFDTTPNSPYDDVLPGNQYDFLHIIVHEIGHILGFGAGNAGDQYVVNTNGTNYFSGPYSTQVYGGSVPLDFASGVHVAQTASMASVMQPVLNAGTRTLPTSLDKAMLKDIGYTVS